MSKGLTKAQSKRLEGMNISSQRKSGMRSHANAKNRSVKHNTEMLNQIGRGKGITTAHKAAVKKVGL